MIDWQPIETAPKQERILFWWVGNRAPKEMHTTITGLIPTSRPGFFWDGSYYRPIAWVTHWSHLPKGPND